MIRYLFLILISGLINAQEQTKKTAPTDVVLYLNSAKVTEQASVTLKKGKNTVNIIDLPNSIDTNTYKVGIKKATLLSVSPTIKNSSISIISEKEKSLLNQKKDLLLKLKYKTAEINALNGELRVIEDNKAVKNANGDWSPQQIAELASYYRKRTLEINNALIKLSVDTAIIQEDIAQIAKKVNIITSQKQKNTKILTLEIHADYSLTTAIEVTYITTACGWQPFYDIRAKSITEPLEIITKGKVFQQTGKNWNNVSMTISTYLPSRYQNRPILNPFYVKPKEKQIHNISKRGYAELEEVVVNSYQVRRKDTKKESLALSNVPVSDVLEQQLNVVYTIKSPQTLLSNSKTQTLILDSKKAEADYKHLVVPKVTTDVFLIASIKNWQNLNLLLTEANIYFEDNFLGKTTINPNYVKDSYPLSLGIDERIIAKKRTVNTHTTKKTFNNKKTALFTYEISLRNNSKSTINIEVLDHMPISKNNKIIVEATNLNNGDFDKTTGSVLWKKTINQGQNISLDFSYSIKYPKDMELQYF